MSMEKLQQIEEFLKTLGEVPKEGFTIICNKCKSTHVGTYYDICCGSEMTGCWGGAGIKCKDCGACAEIYEA